MAGHNKWSKVKHIKGAVDAKRGRIFSKLSREISIAAKNGGKDTDMNPRLRQAVNAARAQNMPGDTIERAIKKGCGELEGVTYEEITYEIFGPASVAYIVETATDNKNRTAADFRAILNRNNGNMGTSGSVAYLFQRRGEIQIPASSCDEDKLLELALEAGADDTASDGDNHSVFTSVEDLASVAENLRQAGCQVLSQKLVFLPQTTIRLEDPAVAAQALRLHDLLDDYDDTINVFSNFDIPDEVLEKLQ